MSTIVDHSQIIEPTLELCSQLMNVVIKSGEKNSAIGCNTRALDTLNDLQELEKSIEVSDNIMVFIHFLRLILNLFTKIDTYHKY
jgi:hypothetical protein